MTFSTVDPPDWLAEYPSVGRCVVRGTLAPGSSADDEAPIFERYDVECEVSAEDEAAILARLAPSE